MIFGFGFFYTIKACVVDDLRTYNFVSFGMIFAILIFLRMSRVS